MRRRKRCIHNDMIERDDPRFAWECADCGYVFGEPADEREKGDDGGREYADPRDELNDRLWD